MRTESSMDWVRRAGSYRVLIGKRDGLGCPLGEAEETRLAELERFFTQDANRRRMPWVQREQIRAPISIVVQFGDAEGRAQDISGGGMYVVTSAPLAVGTRTVVRVTEEPVVTDDEDSDGTFEEWQFGAEVVRVDGAGMGLRFVGIPVALRISHRRSAASPVRHAA